MSFDNHIRKASPGFIEFDCNEGIELGRIRITRVLRFKCPLQTINITNDDSWCFTDGIFHADDPGRYIVNYVPL